MRSRISIDDTEDEDNSAIIERVIEVADTFLLSRSIEHLEISNPQTWLTVVAEVEELLHRKYRYRRFRAEVFGSRFP